MTKHTPQVNRRELFGVATAFGAASLLPSASLAVSGGSSPSEIIDTNVSLFQWPCRRLSLDQTSKLVEKFESLGITQAWAGSFEGVLHRDIAGVNARLAEECQLHPMLLPVGSINPTLPDWEYDLHICLTKHGMRGIRLHPNYHGYQLNDPRFLKLLDLVSKTKGFIQLTVAMEDQRTQHPLLDVPDVDLSPLAEALGPHKHLKVQLLNCRSARLSQELTQHPNLYFDTARFDGTDGVPQLAKVVTADRILLGTHAPFLIPEAALIRINESGQLNESDFNKITTGNARQFSIS